MSFSQFRNGIFSNWDKNWGLEKTRIPNKDATERKKVRKLGEKIGQRIIIVAIYPTLHMTARCLSKSSLILPTSSQVGIITYIIRWANWNSERLNDLSKVTQVESSTARTQTEVCPTPKKVNSLSYQTSGT